MPTIKISELGLKETRKNKHARFRYGDIMPQSRAQTQTPSETAFECFIIFIFQCSRREMGC